MTLGVQPTGSIRKRTLVCSPQRGVAPRAGRPYAPTFENFRSIALGSLAHGYDPVRMLKTAAIDTKTASAPRKQDKDLYLLP